MKKTYSYIHIPFCTSKCKYCRFASFGTIDKLKINVYVNKLLDEIKKSSYSTNINLSSIYFGGGTPSILSENQLNSIILEMKNKYIFEKTIEINLEATPITINKDNLVSWSRVGINRLSIGVQTLNADALREIGRGEKGDIINALDSVKYFSSSIGQNVSVDFIIGLPHVKKGELLNDIKYILDNYDFIKHVSVYMLEEYYDKGEKIEYNDSKFQNIIYPNDWKYKGISDEDYLGEYLEIKSFLISRGYHSYEISNFSKKGYESKHNQAYWNHANVVGYGLSAHSLINYIRFSNREDFLGYYSFEKGDYDILSFEDILLEKIMFGLRTSGLNKKIYEGFDIITLKKLLDKGLIYMDNGILKLTDNGVVYIDFILRELI